MSAGGSPRVLVTGALGFVGSAIVEHLRAASLRVIASGRAASADAGAGYRKLDVLDRGSMTEALRGVDVVIHAAGLAHQFGPTDEAAFMRVNADGTENVVRAAAQAGVPHFVLLSSVAVYGPPGASAVAEDAELRPDTPYAQSKLEAEHRAAALADASGMALTILRLATVYGERDRGNLLRLIRSIDRGRFVWVGSGSNRKSLIHCADVGRACAAALEPVPSGRAVYNVSAPACTMYEIVAAICEALGRPEPRLRVSAGFARAAARTASVLTFNAGPFPRIAETLDKWLADNVYDVSRFARERGFATHVTLRDGFRREVAWYRNAHGA